MPAVKLKQLSSFSVVDHTKTLKMAKFELMLLLYRQEIPMMKSVG